jgi:hypothetical protein
MWAAALAERRSSLGTLPTRAALPLASMSARHSLTLQSNAPAQGLELNFGLAMLARFPTPTSTLRARAASESATQAGLKNIQVESFAVRSPHDFLERSMSGALWRAVESGVATTREEVSEWLGEQAALHASGDFYQAWLFVMVTGTV